MTDADPKNKICDVKSPKDRPLDSSNGEAVRHLIQPGAKPAENHNAKNSNQHIEPHRGMTQRSKQVSVDSSFSLQIHASFTPGNTKIQRHKGTATKGTKNTKGKSLSPFVFFVPFVAVPLCLRV